jgi:hypothetical protein
MACCRDNADRHVFLCESTIHSMIPLVPMSVQPARRASTPDLSWPRIDRPRGIVPPSATLPEERVEITSRSGHASDGRDPALEWVCPGGQSIRPSLIRPKDFFRSSSQIRRPGRVRSYEPRRLGINFCVQRFEALVGCGSVAAMAVYRGSRQLFSPRSSHR